MRFDPREEVDYRVQLAREYLEDAESRFSAADFRGAVQYSQLSVENAAKAVIATRRTPGWGHDPSGELRLVMEELGAEKLKLARRLADITSELAPEHGRTTYGDPGKFLTPRMLYDRNSASGSLELAREAFRLMQSVLSSE